MLPHDSRVPLSPLSKSDGAAGAKPTQVPVGDRKVRMSKQVSDHRHGCALPLELGGDCMTERMGMDAFVDLGFPS